MMTAPVQPAIRVAVFAVLFFVTVCTSKGAPADCTLTPLRSTNNVGGTHTVTALVISTNGLPAAGVSVEFDILSGPNSPLSQTSATDAGGHAIFTYTSDGGEGIDRIRAAGTLGNAFTCFSTQVWVMPTSIPTITCPANITTNAGANCSRNVAFTSPIATGSPMPTVRCHVGDTVVTSPHVFPAGTTTVTCTASNASGVGTCSFTVTVTATETEPPQISCPDDRTEGAPIGSGGIEVHFDTPTATDNCGDPTVVCSPASGTFFSVGTTPVTCTATDTAGNTSDCTFNVTVEEGAAEVHDLAIVRIRAPRVVTLTGARPSLTRRVVVTIQNRSPHTEAFFDQAQLEGLITLNIQSVDPGTCPDLTANLLQRRPQRRLPFNLRPRQRLNVHFEVTFDCAVNSGRGAGSEDFFYTAQVHHEAIDTIVDTHPECDVCPRPPLEGGFDPNPNGRIRDRGCGTPTGGGALGGDIMTDVVVR